MKITVTIAMHSPSTDAFPRETFRFRLPGKQTITGLTFSEVEPATKLAHLTRGNHQAFAVARSTKRDYFRPWLPSANSLESQFIVRYFA
jgi:hypothetical protein